MVYWDTEIFRTQLFLPYLERILYLPSHVIEYVDLGQDSHRLAVLHDDQCISGCQRWHGFLKRNIPREDGACGLDKAVNRFFRAVIVLLEHMIEQVNFLEQANQLTARTHDRHLRDSVLVHHRYHVAHGVAQ